MLFVYMEDIPFKVGQVVNIIEGEGMDGGYYSIGYVDDPTVTRIDLVPMITLSNKKTYDMSFLNKLIKKAKERLADDAAAASGGGVAAGGAGGGGKRKSRRTRRKSRKARRTRR